MVKKTCPNEGVIISIITEFQTF
uniref:Uncharacterized protein n=1 Tax=Anguilla anguilla TaxID=7936 RepID=A0A0E9TME0_ANGAN